MATPVPRPSSSSGMRRTVRRAWIGTAGVTTIAVGLVLIPLPGPGSLVIVAGLTILGREYPRAARAAGAAKSAAVRTFTAVRTSMTRSDQSVRGDDRPER